MSYRITRREHNREMVELYLLTHSMHMPTRPPGHPDEFHGNVNKPQSRPNQDLVWLEAIDTPDARETDNYLRRVLKDLEHWEFDAHQALRRYIEDPSAPENWRREVVQALADHGSLSDKKVALYMMAHLVEDAFAFILYRAHMDGRWLFWPTPEGAKGYVEENQRKRREARYHYFREREAGANVTAAVKVAVRKSGASRAAVFAWKKQEKWWIPNEVREPQPETKGAEPYGAEQAG